MKYLEWKKGYLGTLDETGRNFYGTILENLELNYDEKSINNHLVDDIKPLENFLKASSSPAQAGDHDKFKQALQQSSALKSLPNFKVKDEVSQLDSLSIPKIQPKETELEPAVETKKLTKDDLKSVPQEIKPAPYVVAREKIATHVSSAPLPRLSGWTSRKRKREFYDDAWIQDSYPSVTPGEEEEYFADKLSDTYKPPMASLQSIMDAKSTSKKTSEPGRPSYSILFRSDALQNHNFAVFKDAVMIMASQGNCLESSGRHLARLASYSTDRTQGPASAMSAVDAAIARRIFKNDCDMMLAWLAKYDPKQEHFHYQNGYLVPQVGQVIKCNQLLVDHGKEILMNIQQVRVDNAEASDDHWMTQIPCFALSLGGYDLFRNKRTVQDNQYMPGLCQKLLELQYQAAAKLAVLKSEQLGKRIPLVLTPVGGGVFGNSWKAIANAIQSIAPIIKNANVDVVLSAYERKEANFYRENISFLKDAPEINHQEMSTKKAGEFIQGAPKEEGCVIS